MKLNVSMENIFALSSNSNLKQIHKNISYIKKKNFRPGGYFHLLGIYYVFRKKK